MYIVKTEFIYINHVVYNYIHATSFPGPFLNLGKGKGPGTGWLSKPRIVVFE